MFLFVVMRCYTCDGKKNSDCTKYETCKKDEEVILCFVYDVHVNYVNEQTMIIRVFVVRLTYVFFSLVRPTLNEMDPKSKRNARRLRTVRLNVVRTRRTVPCAVLETSVTRIKVGVV